MEIIFDSIGKVLVIGIVCFAICALSVLPFAIW